MHDRRMIIRISQGTLDRLDEVRGRTSRSAFVRRLIENASPDGANGTADLDEAVRLLSESARAGSIQAQRELVRYLSERQEERDPVVVLAERLRNGGS
jgi:hypothetical protein